MAKNFAFTHVEYTYLIQSRRREEKYKIEENVRFSADDSSFGRIAASSKRSKAQPAQNDENKKCTALSRRQLGYLAVFDRSEDSQHITPYSDLSAVVIEDKRIQILLLSILDGHSDVFAMLKYTLFFT